MKRLLLIPLLAMTACSTDPTAPQRTEVQADLVCNDCEPWVPLPGLPTFEPLEIKCNASDKNPRCWVVKK